MTTQIQTAATIQQCEDFDAERREALAKFLECDVDNVEQSDFDDCQFDAEGGEYLVLTDSEADAKAREYIEDSLWAFNASFLSSETGLPEEVFTAMQDQCEGANDTFYTLVTRSDGGMDSFVENAISADGRGHFISMYDGEENEEGEFFIYRVN